MSAIAWEVGAAQALLPEDALPPQMARQARVRTPHIQSHTCSNRLTGVMEKHISRWCSFLRAVLTPQAA